MILLWYRKFDQPLSFLYSKDHQKNNVIVLSSLHCILRYIWRFILIFLLRWKAWTSPTLNIFIIHGGNNVDGIVTFFSHFPFFYFGRNALSTCCSICYCLSLLYKMLVSDQIFWVALLSYMDLITWQTKFISQWTFTFYFLINTSNLRVFFFSNRHYMLCIYKFYILSLKKIV